MANFRCSGRLSAPLTMTLEPMLPVPCQALPPMLSAMHCSKTPYPCASWLGGSALRGERACYAGPSPAKRGHRGAGCALCGKLGLLALRSRGFVAYASSLPAALRAASVAARGCSPFAALITSWQVRSNPTLVRTRCARRTATRSAAVAACSASGA